MRGERPARGRTTSYSGAVRKGSRSTYFARDERTLRPDLKDSPLDGESDGVGRMRGDVLVIHACGS
ncbi:hypothetical protein ACN6LL_006444 [Streptomyces violaceoruber]